MATNIQLLTDAIQALTKTAAKLNATLGGRTAPVAASPAIPPTSGVTQFAAGILARNALQGGPLGAASRLGLAGMTAARGATIPASVRGALVRDFVTLGIEVAKLPWKIREWTNSLLESQRDLAQFSGTTAVAFAELDAARIGRKIQTAQDTAESTAKLAQGQNKLEEATRPVDVLITNIENSLGAAADEVGAAFVNSAQYILDGIKHLGDNAQQRAARAEKERQEVREKLAARDGAGTVLGDLVHEIAIGTYMRKMNPPIEKKK
jgi:hypothetical protein